VILSWNSTADTVTSDVVSAWGADGVTPTFAANWTAENTPQNLAPSNTWTRYSITATLDTASTNNVAVFIWCDDMTTTLGDFLYITDVQLEVGSLATPFERKLMNQTLDDCYRYYYRIDATRGTSNSRMAIGYVVGTTAQTLVTFPVEMRISPVFGSSTPLSNFQVYNGISATTVTAFAQDTTSPNNFNINIGLTSSLTTNGCALTRNTTASPCLIDFSSEL